MLVLLLAVGWVWLGFGPLHLGALEIDAATYVDAALHPHETTKHQNRYVHVWGLHVVFGLIGNGKTASAVYSSAVSLGTLGAAAAFGWCCCGLAGAVLAGLLTSIIPSHLYWPNSLMVDPTMAFYATLALAAAGLTHQTARDRWRLGFVATSGLACFLALKSKETGVAVVPAVLMLVWLSGARRHLLFWCAGAVLGWCGLAFADGVLLHDAIHSVRAESYKLPNLRSAAKLGSPGRLTQNYVELLAPMPHLWLTMFGICGFAMGRRTAWMKACLLWFGCALAFLACISWIYVGIQPLTRQMVALEVPLALGASYALARQFRAFHAIDERWWITILGVSSSVSLLLLCWLGPAWFGLSRASEQRLLFHVLPIGMVVLALGVVACDGRRSGRILALLAPLAFGYASVDAAREEHAAMAKLAAPLDAALDRITASEVHDIRVGVFGLGRYAAEQTGRQLQMRGGRHIRELTVSRIASAADASRYDLVFAEYGRASELQGAGLTRLDGARGQGGRRQLVLLGRTKSRKHAPGRRRL